jgi:hypothetical protein
LEDLGMKLPDCMYDYREDIQELNSEGRKVFEICHWCEGEIYEGDNRYNINDIFIHEECIDNYLEDGMFDECYM